VKGFGNLGQFSGMLKQAMQMKGKIEELKEQLGQETIESSAGGGMVKVTLTGKFEVVDLKIDPEIIDKEDPEMLETLVRAAVNEGVRQVQEHLKSKLAELTGGIEIPGLM